MKLYVDDIRIPPDKTWHLVRTITEAVRILATQEVDLVSLDHDIAYVNTETGKTTEETFEPVARFIVLMGQRAPAVTIHTANPVGAKRLKAILEGD